MSTSAYWVFVAITVIGFILVLLGSTQQTLPHRQKVVPKGQENETTAAATTPAEPQKDWPQSIQWGYLALLIGLFGWLSNYMSFQAVMLIFVVVTGVVWVLNKWVWSKRRGTKRSNSHFVDYCQGFFPVILLVFLLRSFVAEPFQIPSSSMRPGLIVGDFILVNKFTYGLRIPILNTVFLPVHSINRGDVVVFQYPVNPKVDYIKRAIGLPGDIVEYRHKRLTINGKAIADVPAGTYDYLERGLMMIQADQYDEKIGNKSFRVLNNKEAPVISLGMVGDFPYRENCDYQEDGFVCKVPANHYFMLGDNRDNSADGRYWGFVDDRLIVGKAFMIWMNLGAFSRIGKMID